MYTLVAISIVCAVANNIFLHLLSSERRNPNPYLTNAIISAVWVVALLLYNQGWTDITNVTLVYAFLYGIILTGFIFFKTMAMATGPIALTALIGCSGFIVTTTFNSIYWKDPINSFNVAGMILMITAIFMINYTPDSTNATQEKTSLQWKIYSALFFAFAVATGIFFRFQQHFDKPHTDEMMIMSALFTTFVLLGVFIVGVFKQKRSNNQTSTHSLAMKTMKEKWKMLGIIVICGLCSCAYNRMNMYNTGSLPNTIFFPIFNGGVVILSFFSGWLLFKEKPSKLQFIGVSLGVLALIVFSRFFGIF